MGIVGVGRHGSRYARHAARDIDGIELVAICRRNEDAGKEIARECECEYTSNAVELCSRDDIDTIVLVTVPALLEELVVTAASRGKRLLVEKPVAPDTEVGLRMLSAIDQAGVYCMAGHTLRFNTVVNAIRREIGRIGRIDSIVLTQRFGPQTQIEWIDDPERSGGGNILHTGVHSFDLIRYMTSLEPATAACRTSSVYTERTEDNFAALLTFRGSDATGLVNCARSCPARNGLIEISGEKGQLVGDHVLNTLMWITPNGVEAVELDAPKHTVQEALNALVEDARTGAAPRADFHDGLVAVAVADACYRAAESGQHERVVLPRDPTVV